MPAKSKAQQKFMGMVHGVQKGTIKPSTVSAKVKKAAKGMKKKSATDYASTKHKGLPKKVTVKEISKWLKKLEEFRYRKVRGVDARRVASFVNRGMNEEDLPISLRKKWEHRKYGREKHLANKYMAEYDYDSIQKEGFGGELNDKDKQKFEKARKDNAEVLGYELTGTSDVSETKKRDYKAEYKKFQSSTKAKKYRAELNQYNRKKGTYGNGDGKDASHKGGKIAGFEKESTNRGRREKSRLKKEDIREFKGTQAIHVYLGGIVDAMRKAGIKAKTAKQMKHGFSKSRDKIGFFIEVEQTSFGKKEMYTLQVEIDRDGNLWYLSGHRPMKLGKWADTSKIVRMWKALNKARGFGQDAIFKKR